MHTYSANMTPLGDLHFIIDLKSCKAFCMQFLSVCALLTRKPREKLDSDFVVYCFQTSFLDSHVWTELIEVPVAILLHLFCCVDGQGLVRVHGDHHTANVCLWRRAKEAMNHRSTHKKTHEMRRDNITSHIFGLQQWSPILVLEKCNTAHFRCLPKQTHDDLFD